jgi:hypothetical protein
VLSNEAETLEVDVADVHGAGARLWADVIMVKARPKACRPVARS